MQTHKKLFLLDAMALIYRSYYAMQKSPRITSTGFNTSAVFGFANTLYDLLVNEAPEYIAVATDMAAPTFRKQDFAAYKAQRQPMPDTLVASLPFIYRLIEAFNIPLLGIEGYEADDVIGTLAMQAEKEGFEVFMMTSDKDFGQLVSEHIKIYKPSRGEYEAEILGVEEVCKKFEIQHPSQLIDILGIWGDASDNIPGIPGFGEVTAKAMIKQFGSVENMIANSHLIQKDKWRQKVEEFGHQALMSKELARIITNVPVTFVAEQFRFAGIRKEELRSLLDELEFRTLASRWFAGPLFGQESKASIAQPELFAPENTQPLAVYSTIDNTPHEYVLVGEEISVEELRDCLSNAAMFCFDTETTGLDVHQAELVGVSFCIEKGKAWYLPLSENYQSALDVLAILKPVFENAEIGKTGHNLKFDMSVLRYYEIEVRGSLFDTMIAHYLLEPEQRHNLDMLSEKYLQYKPVSIESLIGKKGKNQGTMRAVDPMVIKEYACEDADVSLQLRYIFEPMIEKNGLNILFYEIEMPLVPVLVAMETVGVKVDVAFLNEYSQELNKQLVLLEQDIYREAGRVFNINSPKQMGVVLFEELKIDEKPRTTATKQYSTSEDVLQKLKGRHPVVNKILEYRSLIKLKSTYVDALPKLVNPRTGRLHTSYNQTVTSTGRLSSTNPNLQNIPIRTEMGREIRKAFIPSNEENLILSADYSQIELRIIAAISGEQAMAEDFKNGLDIHTATASRIFDTPVAEVSPEMRRKAKMVNFGIIYGISSFGLAERLGIPRQEAASIISQYFERYPGIKAYMDKTIALAREKSYVETLMGRRRYLPDIRSSNAQARQFAERNAINAPIQGSAADLIKIAMIKIQKALKKRGLSSSMILQVHDELVFDAKQSELEMLRLLVEDCMTSSMNLSVPLLVDMDFGKNWLDAH